MALPRNTVEESKLWGPLGGLPTCMSEELEESLLVAASLPALLLNMVVYMGIVEDCGVETIDLE